jgi:hypothetical protein
MTTKSKGESVRAKLSSLAHKFEVPYRNLETVFLIERLVARLVAEKKLSQHLVFKGGFVGLRVYGSPRYTIDLDALLVKADVDSTLALAKQRAESEADDGVWFRFESQVDLATQGEYGGIRQVYRAGIGEILTNIKKAQIVNFDMGIGDPVTPGPKKTETPSYFPQNEDISWSVYPIETIIAEKLHALISHGDANSRSKDVHDLAVFLPKADAAILSEALKRSFVHRGTELPRAFSKTIANINTTRLEQGWANAMSSVPNATSFKEAFAALTQYMAELEKAFSLKR